MTIDKIHRSSDELAKKATDVRRLNIGFILARSFTLSAFSLFVDTLRLASDEFDKSGRVVADWKVVASSRNPVAASCGILVSPTSELVDPSEFDYLVVVGGLLKEENALDCETVRYLKAAATKGVTLIGLCTGSFILADAGLLKHHEACVSWLHYEEFRSRFPDHQARADRLFHLHPKRGTCAGGSSSADIAAHIVRQHISGDAEKNAMEVLLIDRARSLLDVQPRRPLSIECDDSRVMAALIAMEGHIEDKISIPK